MIILFFFCSNLYYNDSGKSHTCTQHITSFLLLLALYVLLTLTEKGKRIRERGKEKRKREQGTSTTTGCTSYGTVRKPRDHFYDHFRLLRGAEYSKKSKISPHAKTFVLRFTQSVFSLATDLLYFK